MARMRTSSGNGRPSGSKHRSSRTRHPPTVYRQATVRRESRRRVPRTSSRHDTRPTDEGDMRGGLLRATALRGLPRDGWLLFATRFVRLFAYGLLAVVLVLYLSELGLSDWQIGLLLTLTLLGDTALS